MDRVLLPITTLGLLVTALPWGWAKELGTEQEKALAAITESGGTVTVEKAQQDHPVIAVHFSGEKVTNAVLRQIEALPQVRTLVLRNTRVTDVGLEHLKGLKQLQSLRLINTRITDNGLARLKGLPQLKTLRLERCSLPLSPLLLADPELIGATLYNLNQLPHLESLWLEDANVTDFTLACLRGLPRLTTLYLKDTGIKGKGLAYLQDLPQLKSLYMETTGVGFPHRDVIQCLKGLNQLQGLYVIDVGHMPSLEGLDGLPQLRSFFWSDKPVTGSYLDNHSNFPLQRLKLTGSNLIEGPDLARSLGFPRLQLLGVVDNPGITADGLKRLVGLGQLQSLVIANTKITDAGLKDFARLNQLREIGVVSARVTDEGLKCLRGLPQLQTAWLSHVDVTDSGLNHLKQMSQLQELYLANTEVADAELEDLKELRKLRILHLADLSVSDGCLRNFKELTELRTLYMHGHRLAFVRDLNCVKALKQLQTFYVGEGTYTHPCVLRELQATFPEAAFH
jgi:internalin A